MYYAGIRKDPRANANPLRSLPLFQPASKVFGLSATDKLVGELRNALWAVAGWERQFDKARAALGKANGHNIAWRRASQRDALVALNKVRAAMRANLRKIAALEADLLALAVPADRWADAAASAGRITTPIADGPRA